MNDKEKWRERVRDIRAGGTTWWWWWWWPISYFSWSQPIRINCFKSLRVYTKGTHDKLEFGIPLIRRKPKDHCTDSYFCLIKTSENKKKNKFKIAYPILYHLCWPKNDMHPSFSAVQIHLVSLLYENVGQQNSNEALGGEKLTPKISIQTWWSDILYKPLISLMKPFFKSLRTKGNWFVCLILIWCSTDSATHQRWKFNWDNVWTNTSSRNF